MDKEKLKDLDYIEKLSDTELEIVISSIFELDTALKEHPKVEAKYHRWASQASGEVDRLQTKLEFITAEITDEYCRENSISMYQRPEVRKTVAPLDDRYMTVKVALNNALEAKTYTEGLIKVWTGRSHRLTEITKIADRLFWNEPKVYDNRESNPKENNRVTEGRLSSQETMDFGD